MLGSGAAGLRAAVELKRRGVDVMIATQNVFGGTSACSGSDKQTLHAASGSGRGDDFNALADALGAGGAMDEDVAYVEAVGSPRALASLQFLGLPLPQDSLGGVLRYQTDHDEAGRATSCGPRTSRLMVQVLASEVIRLEAPVLNGVIGVRILVESGPPRALAGLLAMRPKDRSPDNPLGVRHFPVPSAGDRRRRTRRTLSRQRLSEAMFRRARTCARGGDRGGQPHRKPVRHRHQPRRIPLESLRHLRTGDALYLLPRRDGPRAQLPRRVLPDDAGARLEHLSQRLSVAFPLCPHARLSDRASSISRSIASAWPDGACSWISTAIRRRRRAANRSRWIGSTRTSEPISAKAARSSSRRSRACSKMNPLSIELYRRYKKDITRDPLEFAVNNQHMNGGLAVNVWGETSLEGCYAVGEAAGTHGVTRPGGAALVVGAGLRRARAEHIAATTRRGKRGATVAFLIEARRRRRSRLYSRPRPGFRRQSSSGRSRRA